MLPSLLLLLSPRLGLSQPLVLTPLSPDCSFFTVDACSPDPQELVDTYLGVPSSSLCQQICRIQEGCDVFSHTSSSSVCSLYSYSYLASCDSIGGTEWTDTDSCKQNSRGEPSCKSFVRETCSHSGEVVMEKTTITDAGACQELLLVLGLIYQAEYFVFDSKQLTCTFYSSSDMECDTVSGPVRPGLDICQDTTSTPYTIPVTSTTTTTTTSTTSTTTTTFPNPRTYPVILITGGLDQSGPGAFPGISFSTETLGTPCPVPSLPSPRYTHVTMLTPDDQVLTCGGSKFQIDTATIPDLSCLVLDPNAEAPGFPNGAWLPHSTLDVPRYSPFHVVLPIGIYIMSRSTSMWNMTQELTSSFLETGSTEWVVGPTLPANGPWTCAAATSDDKFLTMGWSGGRSGGTLDVAEHDTATGSWASWSQPSLRGGFPGSCQRLGDNVIFAGGDESSNTIILNITTKKARQGGFMTERRLLPGLSTLEGSLLAFGGKQGNRPDGMKDSIEKWDEITEQWSPIESTKLRAPKYGFGSIHAPMSSVCHATV